MRIYLAGNYSLRFLLQLLCLTLLEKHEITSTWLKEGDRRDPLCSEQDRHDIDNSDLVLAFYPFGVGTSGEVAYAIGSGKPCWFCCDFRNQDFVHPWPIGMAALYHTDDFIRTPERLLQKLEEMEANLPIPTLDLEEIMWESLKQSASVSHERGFMPDEYMMNDWVSDVQDFLENRDQYTRADGNNGRDAGKVDLTSTFDPEFKQRIADDLPEKL